MTEWHDGTTRDDQLVAAWYRLKPERKRSGHLADGLSWLRRYPAIWLRIVAEDTDAASIAVRHRWDLETRSGYPSETEIAHVERAAKHAVEAISGARLPQSNLVPFRAAAAAIRTETKRGPIIDHDPNAA